MSESRLGAVALLGAAAILSAGLVVSAGLLPRSSGGGTLVGGTLGGGTASDPAHTITVVGTTTSQLVPDQAVFTASISANKPTVEAARAEAARLAGTMTAAVTAVGIDARDVKTTDLSLSPVYPPCNQVFGINCPSNPAPVAWTMSQSIAVTVRNLDLVGKAIDAAIAGGATSAGSLSFGLADPDAAVRAAQESAVATARAQADALAAKAGVQITGVASIDAGTTSWYPGPRYAAPAAIDKAGAATTVSPGTLDVSGSVTVRFLID